MNWIQKRVTVLKAMWNMAQDKVVEDRIAHEKARIKTKRIKHTFQAGQLIETKRGRGRPRKVVK